MKNPITIKMDLFETDKEALYFLMENCNSKEFNEDFLVLYNFAIDLKYAKYIQEELLEYLLPYYLTTLDEYVKKQNRNAESIIEHFNEIFFYNRDLFIKVMKEIQYSKLMNRYIETLFDKMDNCGFNSIDWVMFYNTVLFLDKDNIVVVLQKIWNDSSNNVKLSFFLYLTVLFFEEEDNIFKDKLKFFYHSTCMTSFDSFIDLEFKWDDFTINYFKNEITNPLVMDIFLSDVEKIILPLVNNNSVKLFIEKMKKNLNTVFKKRIDDYFNFFIN